MASKAIAQLTAASTLAGTESFYADSGSADVKVTANLIKNFALNIDRDVDFNGHSVKNIDTVTIGSTAVIDFSGDISSYIGTGTADVLVKGIDSGSHPTSTKFGQFIFINPTGSLGNTVIHSDSALGIRAEKQNWSDPTLASSGEMDGLVILVRHGGPNGGNSDCSGLLIDVHTAGTHGGSSVLEADIIRYDTDGSTVLYEVNPQIAAGDPAFVGYFIDALEGANSRAFYARESGTGTWSALLFGESAAGVTFSIGIDGSMSWGTGDVTLTYSTNKLSVSGGSLECASYLKTGAVVTTGLPTAASAGAGARYFVTDSNSATFNSTFSGSGANAVPVFSDGSNWRVG